MKNENLTGCKLYLVLWIAFHSFALLMSFAKVRIFSAPNHPLCSAPSQVETHFWPFVKFEACTFYPQDYPEGTSYFEASFNGIFAYYDITEFAFYVGAALFIYLLKGKIKF